MDNFDPITYIHRYACWTAARAVQNPTTQVYSTQVVTQALTNRDFINYLRDLQNLKSYEKIHSKLVNILMDEVDVPLDKKSFGVGAKILAIYFKTALIVPGLASGKEFPELLKVIYPPIDSNVLLELGLKKIKWTKMTQDEHLLVIEAMLVKNGDEIINKGFWIMDYEFNDNK